MTAEDRDERDEFWELADEEVADVEVFTSVRATSCASRASRRRRSGSRASPPSGRARDRTDNLPEEVEPGVTYRDVAVRWQARSE